MAIKGEISIKTAQIGELQGPRDNKTSLIYELKHEVSLPSDSEGNVIQGTRRISLFEIVKSIDRITPLLYNIVSTGSTCDEVMVTLYKMADTGMEGKYFQYKLNDATIVCVQNWIPPTYVPESDSIGHLERVKFHAGKITWTYLDGNITHEEKAY